jgi:hypothetical protein
VLLRPKKLEIREKSVKTLHELQKKNQKIKNQKKKPKNKQPKKYCAMKLSQIRRSIALRMRELILRFEINS